MRNRFRLIAGIVLATPAWANTAPPTTLVQRGAYLARAGDCASCHTAPGGKPFAGGLQIETPYGTLSTPNITPDRATGIGAWSDEAFYHAMHDGLDEKGGYLYPVMPYDHYTKVTRDDDLAIKAWLFTLPPVHAPRAASHMAFPFDVRTSLLAWRTLFFKPATFTPDPGLTDQQNRGAYLVEGLGHCGACHTPRNDLSAAKPSDALGGANIPGQGWFAPNISSDMHEGIGGWSAQQLVDYFKTGVAQNKAIVAGPMMAVVKTSLSQLTDTDLAAMAAYLKAAPPKQLYKNAAPTAQAVAQPGRQAYIDHCAFCHQANGKGIAGAIPPLAGNGAVTAGGPQDVIRTVLNGMPASANYAPMPGLGRDVSSQEIADIANYIRASWGNTAPANATTALVDDIAKTSKSMLAGTAPCAPVAPEKLATELRRADVEPKLQEITAGNMWQVIGKILPRLRRAKLAQADIVNGLTASYCPIVMADTATPSGERVRLLQRFAMLVYTGLAEHTPKRGS